MDKIYEQKYHDLEENEWWFVTRREAVLKFIRKLPKESKILDVGCSSGLLLKDLEHLGFKNNNLFGIDISKEGIDLAQRSGFKNTKIMDGSDLTFEDAQFDIVISSDSLEHMEFDEQALQHWFRVLKPQGRVIVFVPAFMKLWSVHDIVNHHFRRYTSSSLSSKIEASGFKVIKKGYWNFFLFIPIALIRIIKSRHLLVSNQHALEDDLSRTNRLINTFLKALLRIENVLLPFVSFPFGISTFCIAEKRNLNN